MKRSRLGPAGKDLETPRRGDQGCCLPDTPSDFKLKLIPPSLPLHPLFGPSFRASCVDRQSPLEVATLGHPCVRPAAPPRPTPGPPPHLRTLKSRPSRSREPPVAAWLAPNTPENPPWFISEKQHNKEKKAILHSAAAGMPGLKRRPGNPSPAPD